MKEWFTLSELVAAKLPDMPASIDGYDRIVSRQGWRSSPMKFRKATGAKGGGGYEYHYSLLPNAARQKLAFLNAEIEPQRNPASKGLWAKFEALADNHKAICRTRLNTILEVEQLQASGISAMDALKHACRKAGISKATFYEWRKMIAGQARQDWLAALAPSFSASADGVVSAVAECHPEAWAVLCSDYLRPEEPKFSACYRRMMTVAKKKGWAPIPSERTLRRRLDQEVPKAAQILARKGKDAAKKLFPAQRRSVSHLMAMQMVNTDGHKLDLRVQLPNRTEVTRIFLMAMQDVYSRKILSWVLTEAETWEAVRTIIGNMIEQHGIPEHLYMDNGRAFASKKISGGAKSRHRFKITEDEVAGLLTTLGIEPHFVNTYSGQSKPIERGWGDLAEEICKHPAMAGCYTGRSTQHKPENYGQRAVPFDELEAHVGMCIEEHNARVDRRTETAKGRSFDAVFAESMADPANLVQFATEAQRSLWMLTAETISARKPDGSIHLYGNRYWHPALNNWIGKKLTVRFDPSNLHGAVKVYDPQGRLLCDAACVEDSGFDCQNAARDIARARKTKLNADKAALDSARRLSDLQLKELMGRTRDKPAPVTPSRPVVTRLITRTPVAVAQEPDTIDDRQFEDNFARGLARIAGGESAIIEFPKGNKAGVRARKSE
ncbi:DDE-type integrase/transposase/recombinase [Agrobacterium vitis]|uniref:transposase domain-containing protein n=1 Tax=Allorhizobium ampelinum TaxID=3025782 RepID=UPI001F399FB6|nr:transposase domain-containing protein [Allorhizobium ampelinum]MCF1449960.1 DDE-type integrase/transposase/recombinase [Allorhizobium ampelinum]